MTDIDQDLDYSVMSDDENGQCNSIFVQLGTLCLQTAFDNILGAVLVPLQHSVHARLFLPLAKLSSIRMFITSL